MIKNNIPMRNAGTAIGSDQNSIYHCGGGLVNMVINNLAIYRIPAKINATPPTISYFQDINNINNRMNVGILCMSNANIVPQNP